MCIKWQLTKSQKQSVLEEFGKENTLYKVVRRLNRDGNIIHKAICTHQEYIEGLNVIDEDVIVHRANPKDNYKIGIHLFWKKKDAEEVAEAQIKRDSHKDIVIPVKVKSKWITVVGETEHERKRYIMFVAQKAVFPELE